MSSTKASSSSGRGGVVFLWILLAALVVLALIPFPTFFFAIFLMWPLALFPLLFLIGALWAAPQMLNPEQHVARLCFGGIFAVPVVLIGGLFVHLESFFGEQGDWGPTGMVSVYVTRALLGLVMVLLAKGIADTLLSHCTTAADVRRFAFYQVLALAVLGGIGYYFVTNWQY